MFSVTLKKNNNLKCDIHIYCLQDTHFTAEIQNVAETFGAHNIEDHQVNVCTSHGSNTDALELLF